MFLDGQKIGELKDRGESQGKQRFHAAIKLGEWSCYALIQGFAPTPDEAIEQAIDKGLADNAKCLELIQAFAARVRGGQ